MKGKRVIVIISGIYLIYTILWSYRIVHYSKVNNISEFLIMLIYLLSVLTIFIFLSIPGILGMLVGIKLFKKAHKVKKAGGLLLSTISFLWLYLCFAPPFSFKLPGWTFLYDIVGEKIVNLLFK